MRSGKTKGSPELVHYLICDYKGDANSHEGLPKYKGEQDRPRSEAERYGGGVSTGGNVSNLAEGKKAAFPPYTSLRSKICSTPFRSRYIFITMVFVPGGSGKDKVYVLELGMGK